MNDRAYSSESKKSKSHVIDVTPKSDIGWLVLAFFCFIAGVGLSLWGATR